MTIELSIVERDLLLAHSETRRPAKSLLASRGVLIGTADQYNQLRDACSDLLQRIGFDDRYSPTAEGDCVGGAY